MKQFGNLNATESTFNKQVRLVVSDKLGVIARLNVNDFPTDKQCEQFCELIAQSKQMYELLNDFAYGDISVSDAIEKSKIILDNLKN